MPGLMSWLQMAVQLELVGLVHKIMQLAEQVVRVALAVKADRAV
jgi:hypothetical protein